MRTEVLMKITQFWRKQSFQRMKVFAQIRSQMFPLKKLRIRKTNNTLKGLSYPEIDWKEFKRLMRAAQVDF